MQIDLRQPLASREAAETWRFNRALAGGGLFYDMGPMPWISFGHVEQTRGLSMNTGGTYDVEDLIVATFRMASGVAATGVWNFNAGVTSDALVVTTSAGEVRTSIVGKRSV